MPGFLSTEKSFIKTYKKDLTPKKTGKSTVNFKDEQKSLKKLNNLHKKVLPFILRRLKKNVADIPEKIIQDYYVSLSDEQRKLLNSLAQRKPTHLEEIAYLRKLCYNPHSVDP